MLFKSSQCVHTITAAGLVQGAWQSILEAIKGQQVADQEQLLCQAAYYILALIKLRNFTAANAELKKLSDLNATHLNKTLRDGGLGRSLQCLVSFTALPIKPTYVESVAMVKMAFDRHGGVHGSVCAEMAASRCE